MRNIILPLIFVLTLITDFGFAQVCGTYTGSLEDQITRYPEFYQSLEAKNSELKLKHQDAISKMTRSKVEGGKKIIPVVVHVIHNGGGENLSVAQIQNGLDHLNANINGQAFNFSATPDAFAAVRGNLNVEFRLAKIDPLGNPTSGIVRVQSELTVATVTETLSRDRVKALSYWNSYQYFNIWVVQSMPAGPDPDTDPALNGYAQFPYPNPNFGDNMSTDGVMIRAGVFAIGETITHEVGHWLGLRHTWGDTECGSDNVADTPTDRQGTFDYNGTFPFHAGLSNPSGQPGVWGCVVDSVNPAGEMYVNYMDYQADAFQTMFTKGQDQLMNETLDGVYDAVTNSTDIGYREYMWSPENVAATGTGDGYVAPSCTQKADFASSTGISSMCEGEQIIVKGNKTMFTQGSVTSFVWDFGDGETDDSGNNFLSHTYNTAGSYDVTLTIEYDETLEARSSNLADLDLDNASSYEEIVENIIVQGTEAELINLGAFNIVEITLDSLGLYWGMNDSSYFRGELEQVTYVAYYENSCVSSVTKSNFITVHPDNSSSSSSSYSYSFEDESELNGDWVLTQPTNSSDWGFNISGSNILWKWHNGIAVEGSSSIKVSSDDMLVGGSTEIVSKAYDLSDFTAPAIKFSWSGASVNTFPVNELVVTYSDDCGESWKSLGTIGAVELSNAGLYVNSFEPEVSEWDNIVMTKTQLKNSNIRFKFEYVVNGPANNFYLDNIQIGEEASLITSPVSTNSKLSVFPNPAKDNTTIMLEHIADINVDVTLVNLLGAEVSKLFSGEVVSNYHSISADLSVFDKGVYFLKVTSGSDIILTEKVIVE